MLYTCLCEDEYYKENCSTECDLCSFGHTEQAPCVCDNCTLADEIDVPVFTGLDGTEPWLEVFYNLYKRAYARRFR